MLTKAYIPYKGYYSSPFSRWQGSMANENSIELAAETAKRWLAEKNWDPNYRSPASRLLRGALGGGHDGRYRNTRRFGQPGVFDVHDMYLSGQRRC